MSASGSCVVNEWTYLKEHLLGQAKDLGRIGRLKVEAMDGTNVLSFNGFLLHTLVKSKD